MQEEFEKWLSQAPNGGELCFSGFVMPSQIGSSTEQQSRTCVAISSEKDSFSPVVVENNNGSNQGIDLNKTPPQKPKRKKHRPKVIKEGKPAKTPKSITPKPPKDKGEQPSGKRKYVRRKGLNTPVNQPALEVADSRSRNEPKPVRRCLDFDGEDVRANVCPGSSSVSTGLQANACPGSSSAATGLQANACPGSSPASTGLHASILPGASSVSTGLQVYPGSSSISTGLQVCPGSSSISPGLQVCPGSSSISPGLQVCPGSSSVSTGLQVCPGSSLISIGHRDSQGQVSCNWGATTSSVYDSADLVANAQELLVDCVPKGVLFDLNSSINQIQSECISFAENCGQFLQPSAREMLGKNQLLDFYGSMPDKNMYDLNSSNNQMQNGSTNFAEYLLSSPQTCTRETVRIDQMLDGYRTPENPITPPQCFERDAMRENLNELARKNDYMKFATNPSRPLEASLGHRNSCNTSDVLAVGTKRDHNVVSSAQTPLGMNIYQASNARDFISNCHGTRSPTSLFPETYKKMRTENQRNWANGVAANFPSSSTCLSSTNWNTNHVSASNSQVFTLADAQRLMALEKARASERMLAFGLTENNMVKRSNLLSQPNNTYALNGTTNNDYISTPDKQLRYMTADHTQLPATPISPLAANYILRSENRQLPCSENNMATRSNLLVQPHKASPLDVTTNNNCVATPDKQFESISTECSKLPATPLSSLTGNDISRGENCQLEACRETFAAARPSEKPKTKRRPRKERVGSAKRTASKVTCADLLKNGDISCVSGSSAETIPGAKAITSARNGEKISVLLATSDRDYCSSRSSKQLQGENVISGAIIPLGDPLDVIIQKIKFLDINKADEIVSTEPQNALVPYNGGFGAMVPYEGAVKKRRSRAKVDLDPVTNLMWKFLMGKEMSDGVEAMDKDKEKWLDEERKIFRGRIDSFIARMHLVQGDRRFSPWKGSVVDSVVGVFLTQNVSDHLSSSAFMALAAKFPVKSEEGPGKPMATEFHTSVERKDSCAVSFGDTIKLQRKFFVEEISDIGSLVTTEEKEGSNSNESFGSTSGDRGMDCSAGRHSQSYAKKLDRLHDSGPGTLVTTIGSVSVIEAEDRSLEDVVSSQNSAVSSQSSPDYLFQTTDHLGSTSLSNFASEEFIVRNMSNSMGSPTSYTELLRMQDLQSKSSEKIESSEYHADDLLPVPGVEKRMLPVNQINSLSGTHHSVHTSLSYLQNGHLDFSSVPCVNNVGKPLYTGLGRTNNANVTQAEASFYQPSSASDIANKNKPKITDSLCSSPYDIEELISQRSSFPPEPTQEADLISPIIKQYFQPMICSERGACTREHSCCQNNLVKDETEAPSGKQHEHLNLQEERPTRTQQMGGEKFQPRCIQQEVDVQEQMPNSGKWSSSNLDDNQRANSEVVQGLASNSGQKSYSGHKGSSEVPSDGSKAKRAKTETARKRTFDWDSLRKDVRRNGGKKERSCDAMDSIDWEAVRLAEVREISETIRERGMNNMLAERIKDFLNRLVRDHGSVDLEWLRDVDPDKAKDYLLSIRGLGLKSVECVRLLTLHHMAFPVDTNVGRICVRLGWVPLQPLPESLQLHLLELYPILENIQKYLWPRLCQLDQRTLYELHYQMITFGKVFCTKSKPNCNSCPMRAECKHFASAFASARLALPGPEEKSLVTSAEPIATESCHQPYMNSRSPVQLDWNAASHECAVLDNHQPIIEEPATPEPEPESTEIKENALEDAFLEDPDEIPTIKLNFEEFTQNLKSYMQANNIEIEDADMSKALVAINPEAASIPTPKLKNVNRLRTEHQVYELPDSHPLLEGFEPREPDDPCPYLLSIWTPGETAQSTDAPKTFCNSQETGQLCESVTCFSCNNIREVQAQKVRGTLLIPCRTAMRGSFPLNGTYFQVNEVFADHDTSRNPIDIPRSWIWNLPRRTVYFGTSIPTIFKGLTTEDIQHCFWRGFVCVRGFDRTSRAPKPLYARLHFPASKAPRNKKSAASAAARGEK